MEKMLIWLGFAQQTDYERDKHGGYNTFRVVENQLISINLMT